MYGSFFERYAFWKGVGIVISIVTLFSLLGFVGYQLPIITFFIIIILIVAYFDDRIKKLENKIKRFNND